jgi:hypothetical protein
MKKILILLPFAAIILFSCQKEIDPGILGTTAGGTPGGGGSGGTGGGTGSTSTSYHPTTVGSYWKYKDSADGTIMTNTMIAQTLTNNGITFRGMRSTSPTVTDTVNVASPQPQYYYYEAGLSPNSGASFDLLFNYLNDTASVGYTWQYTAGQGNGFTASLKGTIVERNISVTVQGKTYTNVIHSHLDMSYNIFGVSMDVGYYDYFVAKGVGIVRMRSGVDAFGTVSSICSDLTEYHIQ